jgi:hypothetical protein
MRSFVKSCFLIAGLVSLFSFAPKKLNSVEPVKSNVEKKFGLPISGAEIVLNTGEGWFVSVEVPTSSTGAIKVTFVGNIHEPNGTVLTNVNFVKYIDPINNPTYCTAYPQAGGLTTYQYVTNEAQSGFPAGSWLSNLSNIQAFIYIPF